jgi:hypothetical protein
MLHSFYYESQMMGRFVAPNTQIKGEIVDELNEKLTPRGYGSRRLIL